jgi:hypothetical protein
MNEMNERLAADEELAAAYRSAHEAYLAARAEIGERSGIGLFPKSTASLPAACPPASNASTSWWATRWPPGRV